MHSNLLQGKEKRSKRASEAKLLHAEEWKSKLKRRGDLERWERWAETLQRDLERLRPVVRPYREIWKGISGLRPTV